MNFVLRPKTTVRLFERSIKLDNIISTYSLFKNLIRFLDLQLHFYI